MELIVEDHKWVKAMLDIEKDVLTFDVSDEALEIAAGEVSDKANFSPWGLHWPVRLPRLIVHSS